MSSLPRASWPNHWPATYGGRFRSPTWARLRLGSPLFQHVLRLSFYDRESSPTSTCHCPGLFDHHDAERTNLRQQTHSAPFEISVMVHCEYGISRSAAVALFIEALTNAPLNAREFAYEANPWVLEQLLLLHPELKVDVPMRNSTLDRRFGRSTANISPKPTAVARFSTGPCMLGGNNAEIYRFRRHANPPPVSQSS